MSKLSQHLLLVFAFIAGCAISGCDVENVATLLEGLQADATQTSTTSPTASRSEDVITIASFNIQVFGQSKLRKADVMEVLAQTVRKFDIVAIQEIRSKEDVMTTFVSQINSDGHRYDFVIGPRLGRTTSKEQYAFVYDTSRIEFIDGSEFTWSDQREELHREPFVATFRVRNQPTDEAFTFSLVNIHTDPDETDTELDALDDVFEFVQSNSPTEDDVILLGDLNVDADHLGELGQLSNIAWVIPAQTMTNTRGNKSYDNIVYNHQATKEFTGKGGVFDFPGEFQLSRDEALKASDHLPVWAEFSVREGGLVPQVADRPNTLDR